MDTVRLYTFHDGVKLEFIEEFSRILSWMKLRIRVDYYLSTLVRCIDLGSVKHDIELTMHGDDAESELGR